MIFPSFNPGLAIVDNNTPVVVEDPLALVGFKDIVFFGFGDTTKGGRLNGIGRRRSSIDDSKLAFERGKPFLKGRERRRRRQLICQGFGRNNRFDKFDRFDRFVIEEGVIEQGLEATKIETDRQWFVNREVKDIVIVIPKDEFEVKVVIGGRHCCLVGRLEEISRGRFGKGCRGRRNPREGMWSFYRHS
jgi:hypothetical protein